MTVCTFMEEDIAVLVFSAADVMKSTIQLLSFLSWFRCWKEDEPYRAHVLRVRVLSAQMVMWSMLHSLGLTTCLCEKSGGGEVIWTQTRPAIEFVSGEEGLRSKSHFTVLSFVEYTSCTP